MSRNPSYSLSSSGEEDDNQLVVTYSFQPFLVQAGDPTTGVSISASHLNSGGMHTFGEVLPADAEWVVLQAEVTG